MARLGYRVALIDADIGLRNLDLLLGLENRVMFTAMEVLDGECRLEQARASASALDSAARAADKKWSACKGFCAAHGGAYRSVGGNARRDSAAPRHGAAPLRRARGCGAV